MIVPEKPKRGVWIVLLLTSVIALFSALSDSDMFRILCMGLFMASAIWATLYFARLHRLAYTLVVLAIFGVVVLVGGRQQKVPTPLDVVQSDVVSSPPPTTTTSAMPAPAPVPATTTTRPPAPATAAEEEVTSAVDAMPIVDYSEPPPKEPPPAATQAPVVIAPSKPPEYIYLDEITATFHAEGCPQVTPSMSRAVKAAAMLRKFTPHTCVK